MQRLLAALNSPLGLLVIGAIISGLLIQYITKGWQQNDWLFQQRFTAQRVKFEKQIEQRYKLLEDITVTVAEILTHSQFVVVGQQKGVLGNQMNGIIQAYNDAVLKWESANRLYAIRLKTLFTDPELVTAWESIRRERDELDRAIYGMTSNGEPTPEDCIRLIEQISNASALLSQGILTEINAQKEIP